MARELDVELLEDAGVLQDFLHTRYHAVLDKLYRRASLAVQDEVFLRPAAEFDYHRGRYMAMREFMNLPEQIIQMASRARRSNDEMAHAG